MTLLIYCKWNVWLYQFAISTWNQDLEIGPIRLSISSWYGHNNKRYPAERNPPKSNTTSVLATIIQHLISGKWELMIQATFFQLMPRKVYKILSKQGCTTSKLFLILQARIPIQKGVLKCNQIKSGCVKLRPQYCQRTSCPNDISRRPKNILIWFYEVKKCPSDKDSVWMLYYLSCLQ